MVLIQYSTASLNTSISCRYKGASVSSASDESGVFADLVTTEAVCLDMLESQPANSASNSAMDQFNDSKSISNPTPGKSHSSTKIPYNR